MNRCCFLQFPKQSETQSFPGKSFCLLSFGICREVTGPMPSVVGIYWIAPAIITARAALSSNRRMLHLPMRVFFNLQDSWLCVGISGAQGLGGSSTGRAVLVTQDVPPARCPGVRRWLFWEPVPGETGLSQRSPSKPGGVSSPWDRCQLPDLSKAL